MMLSRKPNGKSSFDVKKNDSVKKLNFCVRKKSANRQTREPCGL